MVLSIGTTLGTLVSLGLYEVYPSLYELDLMSPTGSTRFFQMSDISYGFEGLILSDGNIVLETKWIHESHD